MKTTLSGLPRRLVQDGILDEEAAVEAKAAAKEERVALVTYLVRNELADSRDVAVAAANEFGVPLLDLDAINIDLDIVKVGCCGMAGAFGHEAVHYEESKGIYEQSWQPKISAAGEGRQFVATGASCRSQVQRFEGWEISHPLQLLSRLMR